MPAVASTYREPRLTAEKLSALEQGLFDFLVPWKSTLVRPDQAAQALRGGRNKLSFIYAMIDEGKLETLGPRNRDKSRVLITRRSLLLLVAEQFNGDFADFLQRMEALLEGLTKAQLAQVARAATALMQKL